MHVKQWVQQNPSMNVEICIVLSQLSVFVHKQTDSRCKGNIREMHQLRNALRVVCEA